VNILEIIFIIILIVCGLIGVLLVTSTINHNYQLRKEAKKYPPPGKLVKVNNHKTHIYVDGKLCAEAWCGKIQIPWLWSLSSS